MGTCPRLHKARTCSQRNMRLATDCPMLQEIGAASAYQRRPNMDVTKKVVEPGKNAAQPVKVQAQPEHKIQPEAAKTGGSQSKPRP